jgi:hypothetical protein
VRTGRTKKTSQPAIVRCDRKPPVCAPKQAGTRHPIGEPSYVLLCGLAVFGVFWGV